MALAASALTETTCHALAAHAEVLARKSHADEHCCRELTDCAMALATKASADNKEAAGRVRDLTAADMAAMVFILDMRHQGTAGAVQHWAVAECGTALVLPPSGNEALAPMMPPLAAPTAMLASPTCPTICVGVVLSTMGGSPHATPLIVALAP